MRAAALAAILCVGCSVPMSVELELAGKRNVGERVFPTEAALLWLRPLSWTEVVPPLAGADPYADLLALLQQGNPAVNRGTVVWLIGLLGGSIPQGQTFYLSTWANMTQAQQNSLWALYTPQALPWLLSNYNAVLNEVRRTQALLAAPPNEATSVTHTLDTSPQLLSLWGNWTALAERGPGLLRPMLAWAGFDEPIVFAYGAKHGYDVGITMTRRGKERHTITADGRYRVSPGTEWPTGFSLSYIPVTVERGRVTALDVVPSDRAWAFRRLAGVKPDRFLSPTSALIADVAGFRAGWCAGEWWAGYSTSWNSEWFSGHLGLGWPYSAVALGLRTPWPWAGVALEAGGEALYDTYWQGMAEGGPRVWAGPEWLRVSAGLDWALAPTRVGKTWAKLRVRPQLVRRWVDLGVDLSCGFEVRARVVRSGLGVNGEWSVGYERGPWGAWLMGDWQGAIGVRAKLFLFSAHVTHSAQGTRGSVGFRHDW